MATTDVASLDTGGYLDESKENVDDSAPRTSLSTRLCTVARIKSAAAVIVSTRADEPFFRGDEPERSPQPHRCRFASVPVSQRCRDVKTL